MNQIETLIDAWDVGHWEFTLAFEGLADEDLWKRPHPRLLSIGELAGHIAYNEAFLAGAEKTVQSPLVDKAFDYYMNQVDQPVSLGLGVAEVLTEVKKVHEAAKSGLARVKNIDEVVPWRPDMTWYQSLQYRVFHVAYHCGQAYSVRHLMGHTTTDN